jgi:O-antigen/teichoic acid export membrane protein
MLELTARQTWGIAVFVVGLVVVGVVALVLLRWVERGAQQEDAVRRILRNSALPLLIQLVVRAIDVVFVALLFRLVAPAATGNYEFAALLVTLYLGTISEWGLGVLLTREVARDRAAIRQSFGTALLIRIGLSLLSIPIAGLIVATYDWLYAQGTIANTISSEGALLIGILVLTLAPSAVGSSVTSVYFATERPIVPAIANLLNNAISAALRLGALVLGWGVIGVAWGALVATVLNAGIFVWLLRRDFGWPGWSWDAGMARLLLSAAFPLMLNSLLVGVFFRFDTFIINAFQGSAAVAVYGAAYKIAPFALIIPPIVVNALFPRFSRQAMDDRIGLLRGYELTLRILLLGTFPVVAVGSVYAGTLIGWLAGEAFVTSAGPVLAILIWFIPLSYVNGVTQYVLIALHRQGAITLAFLVTACFNLAVNLVLIPRWGLLAAAAVTIASEFVLYLPFRHVLMRELGSAPLLRVVWRPLLATTVCILVMLYLQEWPILAVSAGLLGYITTLWVLRTFTDEDRLLLQRILGRGARPS